MPRYIYIVPLTPGEHSAEEVLKSQKELERGYARMVVFTEFQKMFGPGGRLLLDVTPDKDGNTAK